MSENITVDVSHLIGVPYLDGGRTLAGLDCYGMAIEAEKCFGKKLRDVVYENHDIELSERFVPLLNVRPIDFIIASALLEFHIGGSLHVGVALNDRLMIHSTTNQGGRISLIGAYKVAAIYEVI